MKIYYEKDVYAAIARAIQDRDISLIEDVMAQARDWLEPEEMKQARDSALEAICELLED